ncbi:MAG: O-antigen ligase family protein [Planctomycetota bacterium]|nr:O-antigen ligase family protein [Planctomycetota bacterium]
MFTPSISKAASNVDSVLVVTKDRFVSILSLATAFVVFVTFYFVEHSWDASLFAYMAQESYTGSENFTADRLSQVNPISTLMRLVVASWGFLCFCLAPKLQVRFSSPLFWGLATVGVFFVSSVFWSVRPNHTAFKLMVLGAMVVAAAGIASALSIRELLTAITLVCLSFVSVGLLSELSLGTLRLGGDYRFIGTTHPNTEAIYASILCLIARMFATDSNKLNAIAITLFVIGMGVVWITKSRTTLAGLLASLFIIQILAVRGSNRLLLVTSIIVLLSLGLTGFTMISQSSSGALGEFVTMGRKDDVSSLSGRLPLWEELVDSISKSPLIGYGYLAYWDAKRVEYLSEMFRWEIPHGHNLYLDTLLDVGLLGFILVVLMIFAALWQAMTLYWKTGQIEYSILFGLFIYGAFNGFAESLFKFPNFPLFVVLSCCFSMIIQRKAVDKNLKPVRHFGLSRSLDLNARFNESLISPRNSSHEKASL